MKRVMFYDRPADVRWWMLDGEGRVLDPATFPPRPIWALPDNGDPCTPWSRTESHLHGDDETFPGAHGIHFYGTLSEARKALMEARQGQETWLGQARGHVVFDHPGGE
jgi:hypothetical protein